jgi:hypothetical protein
MNFVIAELLVFVIVGAVAGIGFGIIFSTMGITSFMELKFGFMDIVSILPFLFSLGIAMMFFLAAGLVGALFLTGLFGMAAEALRGTTSVRTMLEVSREFGLNGVVTSVIICLVALILMIVLMVGLGIIFSIPGLIVGTIVFLLIMVFFSLVFPGIVVDNLNPIEAIGKSFYVVEKNYSEVFALLFFYGGLSLILSLIPFIGQVICYFVILPLSCISLVLFYKRNKF